MTSSYVENEISTEIDKTWVEKIENSKEVSTIWGNPNVVGMGVHKMDDQFVLELHLKQADATIPHELLVDSRKICVVTIVTGAISPL